MEGISSHFDHVSNTSVMGQQVLTLGLSDDKAFVPLDSQITSATSAHRGLPVNSGMVAVPVLGVLTRRFIKSNFTWSPA